MGISVVQLLIILLVVLLLFGRGKLPALAEDLGKSVSSFKKGLNENAEEKDEKTTPENNQEKKE